MLKCLEGIVVGDMTGWWEQFIETNSTPAEASTKDILYSKRTSSNLYLLFNYYYSYSSYNLIDV